MHKSILAKIAHCQVWLLRVTAPPLASRANADLFVRRLLQASDSTISVRLVLGDENATSRLGAVFSLTS